ncbi:MAG: glycine C-acetyltransferase [Elusimicrobiota bacterium]|jgi:glycine C-acetyltransferase
MKTKLPPQTPTPVRHPSLAFLDEELRTLEREGRRIRLRVLQGAQEPVSVIDGKRVVNLTSNNYLNLTVHPKLKRAAQEAIKTHGVGTAAVRTIIGTMDLNVKLEERLARFKGTEAALVFQSGFTTNTACCQSLMSSEEDLLISDALNHASIIDGGRLAKSARQIYPHKDMKALTAILESPEARKARRKMIVTDGVFSMDGDLAPLPEIVELAERYEAIVMVDDAHASGVMGKNGRGTPDHFGLTDRVPVQIGTLSKAIASIGGYVASSASLRDYLVSTARPFLFSSSHPPSVTATCIAALDVLEGEPQLIEKLWKNARFFKDGLQALGFDTGVSETPITPVIVGDTAKAQAFSARLFDEGVFALAIGFPTVAKGKERLRTIVSAGHSQSDLETALEKFGKVGRELGLVR